MDPILAAALAISTIITTKALEKTGEKVGEAVMDRTAQVIASLRHKSPETAAAIELSPKNLDYPQTVETLKALADRDLQFAQLLQELVAAAQTDPNPKLSNFISQQPTVYNAQKLADNIKNVFQGNTIIGGTF